MEQSEFAQPQERFQVQSPVHQEAKRQQFNKVNQYLMQWKHFIDVNMHICMYEKEPMQVRIYIYVCMFLCETMYNFWVYICICAWM